jgi:hypothetical protein
MRSREGQLPRPMALIGAPFGVHRKIMMGPADPSDRCFRSRLEARFEPKPDFTGTRQRTADVSILRRGVEGNQAVAVHAVDLKAIADSLRALAKNLRAFRAPDSDFFIDHESSVVPRV